MSGKDLFEQQWQNLHEAMRTESISRRSFMKVAGAAAAAMGLAAAPGAFAAPAPGARVITSSHSRPGAAGSAVLESCARL